MDKFKNIKGVAMYHILTNEDYLRTFVDVIDVDSDPIYKKFGHTLKAVVKFVDTYKTMPSLSQVAELLNSDQHISKAELNMIETSKHADYADDWIKPLLTKTYDKMAVEKSLLNVVSKFRLGELTTIKQLGEFFEGQKQIYSGFGKKSALIVRSAAEVVKDQVNTETAKKMFGEFLYEGDLTVLFSRTNVGKSILSVQIADAIAKGLPAMDECSNETDAKKTLYIDFELSDMRFAKRIGDVILSANMFRAKASDFTLKESGFDSFDDFLFTSLEQIIIEQGFSFVVLDNVSWVVSEMEKSHIAGDFIKRLQRLKNRLGITILVIAHTPKVSAAEKLDITHLAGSAQFGNFVDGVFALGKDVAHTKRRYIKNLKNREEACDDQVVLCEIHEPSGMAQLKYIDHVYEVEMLDMTRVTTDGSQLSDEIKHLSKQGMSVRVIADKLGCSASRVQRYIKKSNASTEFDVKINKAGDILSPYL